MHNPRTRTSMPNAMPSCKKSIFVAGFFLLFCFVLVDRFQATRRWDRWLYCIFDAIWHLSGRWLRNICQQPVRFYFAVPVISLFCLDFRYEFRLRSVRYCRLFLDHSSTDSMVESSFERWLAIIGVSSSSLRHLLCTQQHAVPIVTWWRQSTTSQMKNQRFFLE